MAVGELILWFHFLQCQKCYFKIFIIFTLFSRHVKPLSNMIYTIFGIFAPPPIFRFHNIYSNIIRPGFTFAVAIVRLFLNILKNDCLDRIISAYSTSPRLNIPPLSDRSTESRRRNSRRRNSRISPGRYSLNIMRVVDHC